MESHTPAKAPVEKSSRFTRKKVAAILIVVGILALIGGGLFWLHEQQFVYTDKALVSAPLIKLAPHAPGELKHVFINQGDAIAPYAAVARVGDEMIAPQVGGIAVLVQKDIGTIYQPGQAVVTMIEPKELRIVAQVQEDKGLKDIRVGQQARFTIDAFGSTQYEGIVESVSQTSREGDVVFNISDQRQENSFDVKIQYDHDRYPELQNGMSAKVWIVK